MRRFLVPHRAARKNYRLDGFIAAEVAGGFIQLRHIRNWRVRLDIAPCHCHKDAVDFLWLGEILAHRISFPVCKLKKSDGSNVTAAVSEGVIMFGSAIAAHRERPILLSAKT